MAGEKDGIELLQGPLDLIVMRALSTMGPQHAYGLAARLAQVAERPSPLNQGTLYAALIRLEQRGWIKGTWQTTETNREAKYYTLTKSGARALEKQTERWRRLAAVGGKLRAEGVVCVRQQAASRRVVGRPGEFRTGPRRRPCHRFSGSSFDSSPSSAPA